MPKKILQYLSQHKFIAAILVIAIIGSAYFGFKVISGKNGTTTYALAKVESGTLIVSVSGSGQISASDQIDVKSKASGEIIYVGAKLGQEVNSGALLAQIDAADAQQTVRDAQLSLDDAQLTLQKMQGMTTDEVDIRGVKEKAQEELDKTYDNAVNTLDSTFLDLEDIMAEVNDMLFSYDYEVNQSNGAYYANIAGSYDSIAFQYQDEALSKYQNAASAYEKIFQNYRLINGASDTDKIDSLINETYATLKQVSEALKSATNLLKLYQNQLTLHNLTPKSLSDTHLSNLSSYLSKTNSYVSSLFSIKNTIVDDREALFDTTFDINDQKLQVTKAENALVDAKEKLSDYYVRAPFSGVIAAIDIKRGDTAGSSTTIATLITKQKIAEISLNEVDVAKVKVGQKTTLTFDAIEDLSIAGQVVDVDIIGTTTQNVVSYDVKIGFDTQNEQIKSGMSVSATIITEAKQNVLLIPNSAVKSLNDTYYVEMPNETISTDLAGVSGVALTVSPKQQQIETGLANDSYTEITSGLNAGDQVIIRTIDSSSSSTSSSGNKSGNIIMPGGGGMMRD